jgi:hypothetical protein
MHTVTKFTSCCTHYTPVHHLLKDNGKDCTKGGKNLIPSRNKLQNQKSHTSYMVKFYIKIEWDFKDIIVLYIK